VRLALGLVSADDEFCFGREMSEDFSSLRKAPVVPSAFLREARERTVLNRLSGV
jgi:hypothetical protein